MGQYWIPVNLDKKEKIHPHKLGAGMKLGEQLGGHVGSALVILTAAMRERRGGGDFDWDSNYYGPERDNSGANREHNIHGAPVVEEYNEVAKRTIGRWAGDRIALVGDYAEDSDLAPEHKASGIYDSDDYTDITDDVSKVIEHECGGEFVGDGWRTFRALNWEAWHEERVQQAARKIWDLHHPSGTWEPNAAAGDTEDTVKLARELLRP